MNLKSDIIMIIIILESIMKAVVYNHGNQNT